MNPVRTLVVLSLALVVACASTINSAARTASKAAFDEGAEELTQQDTQENLKRAANDPDMQAATTSMTDQVAEGVLKALESERAHAQLAALTRTITDNAVRQLVAALSSKRTSEQLIGLTGAVTDAALKQAAQSLQSEFRPAIQAMISEDVAPGLATALSSQLQPALEQTAQTVAYNAVLGANDGLGHAWGRSDGVAADVRSWGASGLALL